MATPANLLEVNARKVKRMFFADLQHAQETGKVSVRLFSLVRTIGTMTYVDVQGNEGVNALLKSIKDKAPNISLPLLSSRVVLKKELGVGTAMGGEQGTPTPARRTRVLFSVYLSFGRGWGYVPRWLFRPEPAIPGAIGRTGRSRFGNVAWTTIPPGSTS